MQNLGDVSDFMTGTSPERLKVLVPLDGSVHAEGALAYLRALAPAGALDIHLVAAIDDIEFDDPERNSSQHNLLDAYLKERSEHLTDGVVTRETRVIHGSPATVILDEAERLNADLIVISSHSRTGVQRWRLGSVADKVVRAARCDILVIGHEVPVEHPSIRAILLPLDGSPLAEQAIPDAQRYAERLGAELHILRVVPPTSLVSSDPTGIGYTSPEIYEALGEAAESYISQMQARVQASKASTMFGMPAESLLAYCEDNNIDLVIMTSHGRSGLLRAALGSVTDRLLGGKAPVLIVRSRHSEAGQAGKAQ